jgi:hypothetical protein
MQQRMRSILLDVLLDFKGRAAVVLLVRLFRHNSVLVLENLQQSCNWFRPLTQTPNKATGPGRNLFHPIATSLIRLQPVAASRN